MTRRALRAVLWALAALLAVILGATDQASAHPHPDKPNQGHHRRDNPQRITPRKVAAVRAALAPTAAASPASWNTLMGAGDIDADPAKLDAPDLATSELLMEANPPTVFTAGDNQYPWGQLEDFESPDGYGGSWGRGPLKAKTCPAVGNHEYLDPRTGPAGYLDYFVPPCPHRAITYATTSAGNRIPTVYAFRCAPGSGWWCYVLDSQCLHHDSPRTEFGPSCALDGNMLRWFRAHMAAHPTSLRLVFWHHPRWLAADARGREDPLVANLYATAAANSRACLIVNGHSHDYARFTSIRPDGVPDPTFQAPRSITIGTGGAQLISYTASRRSGVRYADDAHHGVLRLTLTPQGWSSEFDRSDGVVADKAAAGC